MKIIELFAGIGACSKALDRLKIPHTIVDAVEIDKYAIKSFNAIHGTNFEPQDITKWDKDIECDLLLGGFPCQDISVAGKQAGIVKGETRSGLMYEMMRIIEKLKPKYVIAENVKNILSKKHKPQLDEYITFLESLGYEVKYQVLDASKYGIPQHRERCFVVGILGGGGFEFPEPIPLEKKLKDMLEDNVDEKYYLSDEAVSKMRNSTIVNKDISNTIRAGGRGSLDRHQWDCVKVVEPFCVASRGRGENNEQHLEPRMDGNTNTITSVQKDNYIATPYRIRKLTEVECWRLMGFDDSDIEKARASGISKTQLYKQAGNSIVVNVLEAIFKELFNA